MASTRRSAVMSTIVDAFHFLTTADNWSGSGGIAALGRAHIWISFVATVVCALIALPAAILLAHAHRAPVISVALVNLGRAIPSLAIVTLVLPFSIRYGFGLGFWPTCVALVALGIPPMFTNAYAGVAETPPELLEAGTGIGMTGGQLLRKVELPSSLPLLLTGVRISAVQIVATAALGALVGHQNLGTLITEALARGTPGRPELVAGALLVAALALIVETVLDWSERRMLPWAKREK
jgi:osmoprotectant transport system permease protein